MIKRKTAVCFKGLQVKIVFNREKLLLAVNAASAVAPSRTPKDVLRNILMRGRGSSIELVATDAEIGIRSTIEESAIESESNEKFELLIPPQRLRSILSELKDDRVELLVDDRNLTVKGSQSKFRVMTEDPAEFPPVPTAMSDDCFEVSSQAFATAIQRTEFAVDTESTRYALGGVCIRIEGEKCVLAATDSRRLSVVELVFDQVGKPAIVDRPTIIPVKAWRAIRAACAGADRVQFVLKDNDATFRAGNTAIYTKLVEGRFPRYRDVIPKRANDRLSMAAGPLNAAVRQASICLDAETRSMEFAFIAPSLVLTGLSATGGEAKVSVLCAYDGANQTISLDPKFVIDFLKTFSPETIVDIRMVDADTAVVFEVPDSAATYVIMPQCNER